MYVLSSSDVGARLRVVVSALNSAGSRSSASSPTAAVTAASVATPPVNAVLPSTSGTAQSGQSLTASVGSWSGSTPMSYGYQWKRCAAAGSNCSDVSAATGQSYTLTSADVGDTVRVAVTASNSAGTTSAVSSPTATVTPAPAPAPPPGTYFSTLPARTTLPRDDSYCASAVTPNSWEPRPDNNAGNDSYPADPTQVPWNREQYWSKWMAKLSKVTGHYTGTTTEILQWAACKWGLDEDTLRAVAVQESSWHQSTVGDNCGTPGWASVGLMQIKNKNCSGTLVHGGYPASASYTALNVDFYAARLRACYDGDFYDGGSWLYGGKTVDQIAATNGWPYVLWGCVGAWFSGSWYDSGAVSYINQVKAHLAQKTWLSY